MFLSPDEVATLTGRRQKSRQVAELRRMGVAFRINAAGRPVVVRSAVEGRQATAAEPRATWTPRLATI
jgi:hypothetical protein